MTIEQKIEAIEKQLQELKQENKPKFKKGDFIFEETNDNEPWIFILSRVSGDKFWEKCCMSGNYFNYGGYIQCNPPRLATESEKQQLLANLS